MFAMNEKMILENKHEGLTLCHLLLEKDSFNKLRFVDTENNVVKSYSMFPKQRLSSFIKNNQKLQFEEWKLNRSIRGKNVEIAGDAGTGVIVTYKDCYNQISKVYVSCSEFLGGSILTSVFRKQRLFNKIEKTLRGCVA